MHALYERLPSALSPAALAFVRSQTPVGSADPACSAPVRSAIETKLDALRQRCSGPFTVDGAHVSAAPMFRMNGGFNGKSAKLNAPLLYALCEKAGLQRDVGLCLAGRATPRQLVAITQMLLDRGQLEPGSAPVTERIRQMQWMFGIGLDCVGYTWQAVQEVHGPAGRSALPDGERVNALPNRLRSHFVRAPAESARAGDVINLVAQKRGEPGHNVIVRRNELLDGSRQSLLSRRSPEARQWLLDAGPIHVLDVDSSWGAGPDGSERGGARTDTWMYNTRTKEWADFDAETGAFQTSKVGPQDERSTGSYRPRGAA